MTPEPAPTSHDFLAPPGFTPLAHGLLAQARFAPEAYDPGLFDAFCLPCPPQIARAQAKRRADFLAGRLLARHALTEFGAPASDLPIGADRAPVWPVGLNGSISHSGHTCAVLVARDDHLCGVDCEGMLGGSALDAVLKQCLSPGERDWTQQQSRHPAALATSLVFSAKESIFKALAPRVQQFFGFECAEVTGWEDTGCLTLRLTRTLHPDAPEGLTLRAQYEVNEDRVVTWILLEDPGRRHG